MNPQPRGRVEAIISRALVASLAAIVWPAAAWSQQPPQNRKVLRAVYTESKITIDGELTEPAWQSAQPATNFIQRDPTEGAPASEWTEVRVLYDRENLYIGAYCHETNADRIIVNNIRRDFAPNDQDTFSLLLDTFHDRRNGYTFGTTPRGGQRDLQFFDEGRYQNLNWDGSWSSASRIHENDWTVEFAIPFKTLRFSKEAVQLWGAQFTRWIQRKGEGAYWAPIPRRYVFARGVTLAGDLIGLEGIKPGKNLYVKPFALAGVKRFESRGKGTASDFDGGLDLKYGLTPNMTLDVTGNTDFSHVEADTQQINLTRFPLFFPEKRDFFLENAGLFQVGHLNAFFNQEVLLFHSRRIGLVGGEPVPLAGGARLSGRAGRNYVGLMNIQTRSHTIPASDPGKPGAGVPAANFTVARFRRDILGNSNVGTIFVNRRSGMPNDTNRTFGADAHFLLRQDLQINGLLAKTQTHGLRGQDALAKIDADWQSNLLRLYSSYLDVRKNFNPQVGFVRRPGRRILQNLFEVKPRPRPGTRLGSVIRDAGIQMNSEYVILPNGQTETKFLGAPQTWAVFQDGGGIYAGLSQNFERLTQPFTLQGVRIPAGDYRSSNFYLGYNSSRRKPVSGTAELVRGDFFGGTNTLWTWSGTIRANYHFSTDVNYQRNHIELPGGSFVTHLASLRTDYAFNPKMFLSAFIQYNSDMDQVSSNIRFRLIHHALSDFYVVYNDAHDRRREKTDWSLTLKYTHLLNF